MLTIGDVATQSGFDTQTIRYYEQLGLIECPARNESGYRVYTQETFDRLLFIRRAKESGFTLKEIQTLILFAESSRTRCDDVRLFVEHKLEEIENQVLHLEAMKIELQELLAQCRNSENISECPTLRKMLGN